MRLDLLEASESVNWAASNFPSFQERLNSWRDTNVYVRIEELPADQPHDLLVADTREFLPFAFNVEAGAYINTIRSSLDLLAVAIAKRNGITGKELNLIYFPVARDQVAFNAGDYKGKEFVKRISASERAIIEFVKPYKGGNELLWSLHDLDIMRKHKRLLEVDANPAKFNITGWGLDKNFTSISTGWAQSPGKTILGLVKKGFTDYQVQYSSFICINEPGALARKPVIVALHSLAGMANAIIARFDF